MIVTAKSTLVLLPSLEVRDSVAVVKREKKPTRCNNQTFIINFCLNMFWASLCPSSREQRPCYCIWCTAVVLLDVVGSGCGALRCSARILQCSAPMQQSGVYYQLLSQHVSGIIMPIIRRTKNTVFVLLMMGIMMPKTC